MQRSIISYGMLLILLVATIQDIKAYPIDGFFYSGIRRILRLERILNGDLKETPPILGAQKSIEDIRLNLYQTPKGQTIDSFPSVDPAFQKKLNALFPNLHESYSIAVLDITPNQPVRYAKRQENRGFQPGSVGKLAVVGALFCELENLYPDSFSQRIDLLKTRMVKGGPWAVFDEHTVPFFNPEKNTLIKRQVNQQDIFSLFEWADHMLSVSNNGAASVVWKEAILMRVFGKKYLTLTEEEANNYFSKTPKSVLSEMAISVVNDPLRSLGIKENEWRLGTMFTRGATAIIPGKGGSLGTPAGLMKWLLALEQGKVTDSESSLEIKRLMYMTDRRIRYAANPALKDAAVYFKSGSLYKCNRETMPDCGKYMGNVDNYMNSVAIVEQDSSAVYIVALMSNVLRKNSNVDHNALGGKIHKMILEGI